MCSTHNTTHGIDIFSSFILVCGADLKHIVNLTCYRGGENKKDCIGSKFVLHDSKVPEISMPWVVLWVEHSFS